MDYKVIWTDEAITDLREIVAFISTHNPIAAIKFGETLIQKSMILAAHPRMGRTFRKAPNDSVREFIVRPYRVIYEINDQEASVYIRLLWHGARQEPEL